MTFDELNEQINNCQKCRLFKGALHAVPGEGPRNAEVMIIGQNPGEEEDKTGRPFMGRSGKYLNKILIENGINRKKLFITSVVKHKTPANRKLKKDEIEACVPYLYEQVEIIKPKVIILMGEIAKKIKRQEGITYFETYHPAAALRFLKIREKFKKDFEEIGKLLKDMNITLL